MKAQDLKKSILQYAMQGKLVPQDPNDEPASELLKRIKAEKEQLIKDGKIKKEKNLLPITQDEIPYDLPQGWQWVRLGEITSIARGGSPRPIQAYLTNDANGIPWIKIGDTQKNGKYINSTKEYIIPEGISKSRLVHKGDFLLTNSMSFGRPYILNLDGCIHDGWLVISNLFKVLDNNFLYYLLSSNIIYVQFCTSVSGAVVKNLNSTKVADTIIPLPPQAEQKRIVEKLEEILPLVDEYGKNEEILSEMNQKLPKQIRQSILQYAVQGKLVEQNPQDEPASELLKRIKAEKEQLIKDGKIKKEKPLPPITQDEIPYDLPQGWVWVRLGDIITVKGGKRLPVGSSLQKTKTDHVYIRVTDMQNNTVNLDDLHYISEDIYKKISQYVITENDLYIVIVGSTIGKVGTIPSQLDNMNLTENAARLILYKINKYYLLYALMTDYFQTQLIDKTHQVGQPKLALQRLKSALIPLPPLAEQKRIVAKVEELLNLVNKLEVS